MSHGFSLVLFCVSVHITLSSLLTSRYWKNKRNKMLKTILRHGCRLRPAVNMRLSTSLSNRLHTLSPSNTYQNGQVC